MQKSSLSSSAYRASLRDFHLYLLSERGLQPNTIMAYTKDTEDFLLFLEERTLFSLEQLTVEILFLYFSRMKEQNYAATTLSRHMISLKVFFKLLFREKQLKENFGDHLETPKIWQLIPEIPSEDEVTQLLKQPGIGCKKGLRDTAILELLYATGIRVSELCSLEIQDVDDTFIRVTGKGEKTRLVPLGKEAIKAIDAYLSFRSDARKELFLSRSGKPIDRIAIWKAIKDYAKKAGIEKNISPHTLRHAFASHLLRNGADLRVIQDMLGHSHISSTDRYTHVQADQLQAAFQKCHPRWG